MREINNIYTPSLNYLAMTTEHGIILLRGRVCGFYLLSAHSDEQSFQEILPAAPVSQQLSELH